MASSLQNVSYQRAALDEDVLVVRQKSKVRRWPLVVVGVWLCLLIFAVTNMSDKKIISAKAELRKESSKEYEFGSCSSSGGPWEDDVTGCEVWNTSSTSSSSTLTQINELIISTGKYSPYLAQAYASWRYWLNGPIGGALGGIYDGEDDVQISVTSRKVKKSSVLSEMLAGKSIPGGTLVFFDVLGNIDQSHGELTKSLLEDYDARPGDLSAGCDRKPWSFPTDECLNELDSKCAYIHTDDLLLRVSLLRAVLSYEKPLTLVLTGDIACRLRLPSTHHRILLANDGAWSQAADMNSHSDVQAWPQGLEDYETLEKAQVFAGVVSDVVQAVEAGIDFTQNRQLLLSASYTYYFRKPSRVALHSYLNSQGGADALANLGTVSLEDERDTGNTTVDSWTYGSSYPNSFAANQSIFTLCPAGDIWSSGRIIEAMLLGSVPVVDATYETDGGRSAKGCHDPAAMYRENEAPFLFLDSWNHLSDRLALEMDDADLSHRASRVLHFSRKFARTARKQVLEFAIDGWKSVDRTTCTETALSTEQWAKIKVDAAEYYSSATESWDKKSKSAAWFYTYEDNPSVPGCGCSKKALMSLNGGYCFDAACAPPLVGDFSCSKRNQESSPSIS